MHRSRLIGSLVGLALIIIGIGVGVGPFLSIIHRNNTDSQALQQWNGNGKNPTKVVAAPVSEPTACSASSAPATDYLEMTFPSLQQYGYAIIAGNGNWSLLDNRSAVHWYQSPAPGRQGNLIVAFHREPDFEYITDLNVNDTVTIEDRNCNVYTYTITNRWTLNPANVTQLDGTSGFNLTLITCTPWWQDYDRIVWRAALTDVNGKPFVPGAAATGIPGNTGSAPQPSFPTTT